jgi:general secretion pathway protein I
MRRAIAPRARGFTLLEVMIGLALLGLALTVLIKSAAGDIFNAQQAHMMGVATDLARGKMYEIEEKLIKDGFSDTEQAEDDRPFEDEGWPQVLYSYKVEVVELPSWDQLQAIATGRGSGGSGSNAGSSAGSNGSAGSDEKSSNAFGDSALGGMLSQFGGFGGMGGASGGSGSGKGGDIDSAMGASFIQGQYQMFQQILKVTIRKVTLTMKWKVLGSDRDMKVVAFFTDAASMDKVLSGMGSQELPADGTGGTPPGGKPPGGTPPGGKPPGGTPGGTPGRRPGSASPGGGN